MKMPLVIGIPLLVLLWVAGSYFTYSEGKTAIMVVGLIVALWTAFSLPIPPRHGRRYYVDDEEDGGAGMNPFEQDDPTGLTMRGENQGQPRLGDEEDEPTPIRPKSGDGN